MVARYVQVRVNRIDVPFTIRTTFRFSSNPSVAAENFTTVEFDQSNFSKLKEGWYYSPTIVFVPDRAGTLYEKLHVALFVGEKLTGYQVAGGSPNQDFPITLSFDLSGVVINYNPKKAGEGLFSVVRPIINKKYSSGEAFKTELANAISSCVCTNEVLTGAYVGTIPGTPPVPSTMLIPTGKFVAVGKQMSPAIPLNYVQWLKNTLASTLTWQIVANTPHTITTPPMLKPLTTALELLGDLSSVQTPEGVWALLCDIIMFSIQSAPNRIIPLAATCNDGSSGTITWLPLDIPSLTHDFVYAVDWDVNNTKLVEWVKQYIDVDNEILYGTIEIPLTEQMYPAAAVVWKGLKEITHNCKFYKKQSSGEKILLATA